MTTAMKARMETEERAQALGHVLADTYTLYLKTHFYHWNVTGPAFHDLHLLFEQQYQELWMAVDAIAERIRALGHVAPGTSREFMRLTTIGEDETVPDARTMLAHLLDGHETVAGTARTALAVAEEQDDPVTVDVLTQRLQAHEQAAWMLRSMLE